jgi:plastocyanin
MKKTCWSLGIAAVALVLVMIAGRHKTFALETSPEKTPEEVTIKIENFSFSPETIQVPVGGTVRWTNKDDIPHNVMSDDKSLKSKTLDTDENFSYKFSQPGTYSYYCSIHPKMTGKIVVK